MKTSTKKGRQPKQKNVRRPPKNLNMEDDLNKKKEDNQKII
jgi:hypothetical protein